MKLGFHHPSRIILPGDSPEVAAAKAKPPPDPLGIDATNKLGPAQIGASRILPTLGAELFAEFKAVRVPGKVAWLNFDLARQMGFEVPANNAMTPALEEAVLAALSYRALKPGESADGRPEITMYADRYGGSGIGQNLGAGRAGFLPWGNLNIKGVGNTPLSKPSGDFQHSHGGAPMQEGLLEAIWGEVNMNLFTRGSTQILAVIDTGDYTQWPDGSKEKRALIVRAGTQIRPAHMLGVNAKDLSAAAFVRAAEQLGVLARQANGKPDLSATFERLIEGHARTAAEQYRWRILHGAVSTSNMELDGRQLDLATETTQRRTAPIKVLSFVSDDRETFGVEHRQRATELDLMMSGLHSRTAPSVREDLKLQPVHARSLLEAAYQKELELQMLSAAGLKRSMAEEIQTQAPELATEFKDVLTQLGALSNRHGGVLADKELPNDVAVADIFGFLQAMPGWHFANLEGDRVAKTRELLAPIILKSAPFGQQGLQKRFDELSAKLASLYGEVMDAAVIECAAHYDDEAAMKRSIAGRAGFENEPIDLLYRAKLKGMVVGAVSQYEHTKDPKVLTEAIDKTIAASVRDVDALMKQGSTKKLPDGGLELAKRTIDGIDYSVRAWPGGKRRLHLALPIRGDDAKGYHLESVPGRPHLFPDQIDKLSFRFTTDGWKTSQEVKATRQMGESGPEIHFDIPVLKSDAGRLEGLFHCTGRGDFWLKDGASNFRGYTFAVPDEKERAALAGE